MKLKIFHQFSRPWNSFSTTASAYKHRPTTSAHRWWPTNVLRIHYYYIRRTMPAFQTNSQPQWNTYRRSLCNLPVSQPASLSHSLMCLCSTVVVCGRSQIESSFPTDEYKNLGYQFGRINSRLLPKITANCKFHFISHPKRRDGTDMLLYVIGRQRTDNERIEHKRRRPSWLLTILNYNDSTAVYLCRQQVVMGTRNRFDNKYFKN